MTEIWLGAFAVLVGCVLGSFAGTAALRAARGRPWLSGRSVCDSCRAPIPYAQSIPVVGYACLRGRCGGCRSPIDRRHLAAEIAGGAGALLAVNVASWPLWAPAVGLAVVLVAISIYDIERQRIPDGLTALAAILALCGALLRDEFLSSLLTAIVIVGVLWAARRLYARYRGRQGLGLGDVKLIGALTLWTGVEGVWLALALACLLGLAVNALLRRGGEERLAFGPFLGVAFWSLGLLGSGA